MVGENKTIIDVNAAVTGQFHGKDIQILGRFEGELRVSGSFVMGEGSHVEAKVQADKAEISGRFAGEIVARHLVFLEKANVSGTVDTQTFAVHEGAVINGPVTAGEGARTSLDPAPPVSVEPASPHADAERGPTSKPDAPEAGHKHKATSSPAAPELEKPNE